MSQHLNAVRANILRGFDVFLARRGVAAGPMLQQFALPAPEQNDFERDLPFDRVAQLLEHAAIACGDPDLGLSYAKEYPVGGTGLFAFLFLNSKTVEDALRTAVRYAPLLRIPFKFAFEMSAEGGSIRWRPTDDVSLDYKQIYKFGAALLMIRLRSLLPSQWQPLLVTFQFARPDDAAELEKIFGPNIVYSSPDNAILVDALTLQHAIPQSVPNLRDVLERYGEQEMAGVLTPDDKLVEMTRNAVIERMGERRLSLEDVATGMNLSPRTLQARLAAMGKTFEEIVNETRKSRAEELMKRPELTLTDIAYQLGFSEPSSFTRAAQRWFGRAPSAQRQKLKLKIH